MPARSARRPRPAPASADQPGAECPRRDRRRGADRCLGGAAGARWPARARGVGHGHRSRHQAGAPPASLRGLLHDEGERRGHGARTGDLPGHRAGPRRQHRGHQRARRRDDVHDLGAGGGDGGGVKTKVLVVDNDAEMVELLQRHLEHAGYAVVPATSGTDALEALEEDDFDVLLTDLVMDEVDGLRILRATAQHDPRPRVILMTAFGSLETAIDAIRHGAYDYLTKPFKLDQAMLAVARAVEDRRLRDENRRLKAQVQERYRFENIVGRSKAMQEMFEQIRAVAVSDASILLLGESGTGKELVARAIHQASPRADGPFVPVNCGAIPENLLESELFGHEKGAFTGALRRRRGLFAEAGGGSLFLDEVGDIPLPLQGKLLRALQDKTVRPVGGSQEIQLDLRVISATHRDLPALVADGTFREDLYYRLAVIPVRLPSLRERPEDIMLLATHFLGRSAAAVAKRLEGFDEDATAWLLQHSWPGNVRELENAVERAATLARGPLITLADLRVEFATPKQVRSGGVRPTLAELQDEYVQRVLQDTRGDKQAAARILGVSVRTLRRWSK